MLVVRRTLQVKDRDHGKFVEMVKSWPDLGLPSPPHGQRIYTFGQAGPWNLLIWEQEFELDFIQMSGFRPHNKEYR